MIIIPSFLYCYWGDMNFGDTYILAHNSFNIWIVAATSTDSEEEICILKIKYDNSREQIIYHSLMMPYLPLPPVETCDFGAILGYLGAMSFKVIEIDQIKTICHSHSDHTTSHIWQSFILDA